MDEFSGKFQKGYIWPALTLTGQRPFGNFPKNHQIWQGKGRHKNFDPTKLFLQVPWTWILNWTGLGKPLFNSNFKMAKSNHTLPGYDCASSSKKEVPWIGISCISQVQLPWGRLPGNGQVFPENLLSAHVSSQIWKYDATCEVVHPPTSSWPSSSTGWVVAAAFMSPDIASVWAPPESTWRKCC